MLSFVVETFSFASSSFAAPAPSSTSFAGGALVAGGEEDFEILGSLSLSTYLGEGPGFLKPAPDFFFPNVLKMGADGFEEILFATFAFGVAKRPANENFLGACLFSPSSSSSSSSRFLLVPVPLLFCQVFSQPEVLLPST